jgi:hypothetical protein
MISILFPGFKVQLKRRSLYGLDAISSDWGLVSFSILCRGAAALARGESVPPRDGGEFYDRWLLLSQGPTAASDRLKWRVL